MASATESLLSRPTPEFTRESPDEALVRACLRGDESAWSALIDKYKRLIYSIPVKYRFSQDEASEIFQAACFELLKSLGKLHRPRALAAWLIRTTAHECQRRRTEQRRWSELADDIDGGSLAVDRALRADEVAVQAEREYLLEGALQQLAPRCREMVHMLFFEQPARPYREIAQQLGLAEGSIGFTRARCLERLRHYLQKAGFR
jgi:RNA polymerase sigma factor (sigma-70 family)